MTEARLLEIDELCVRINGRIILNDVSLSLRSGNLTALIGPSGSGKSMTALAIMGLLPDNAVVTGKVSLASANLLSFSEAEMCHVRGKKIAMVFQEPMTALNPMQTIQTQVAEVFRHHGHLRKAAAMEKASQALIDVELPPETVPHDLYPHQLSGGQRQRVVIAIAIALCPDFLIADEPTTALDATTQKEILDLLQRLACEKNIGVLLITHDKRVVATLADEVATIEDGVITSVKQINAYIDTFGSFKQPKAEIEASETQTPPVLSVRKISCDYVNPNTSADAAIKRVVDGVDFDLRHDRVTALVGESGSGKSTLARAILGLHPLAAGTVELNGEVFPSAERTIMLQQRSNIQIVFQDPYSSFDPRFSIAQIIAQPLNLVRADSQNLNETAIIDGALVSVGLEPEMKHRYPHQFSGGQRQRIALARALVVDPTVLILDEATSALDTKSETQILSLLRKIKAERRLSILFITHDLSLVEEIADDVMVMKKGRIVDAAPTRQLFLSPKHDYTQSLLGAILRLPGERATT